MSTFGKFVVKHMNTARQTAYKQAYGKPNNAKMCPTKKMSCKKQVMYMTDTFGFPLEGSRPISLSQKPFRQEKVDITDANGFIVTNE